MLSHLRISFLPAILTAGMAVSCGSKPAPPPAASAASPISRAPVPDVFGEPSREADDVGRFLAGVPGKDGSAFRRLEQEEAWQQYARRMDELWRYYERNRVPAMTEFSNRELAGDPFRGAVIYYPFSGADALTVLMLFPDSRDYALVALEPPGTVPPLDRFEQGGLEHQLPRFGTTLASLLGRTFFVTREMDRQLRGQVTDGVFPLLLVELVRTRHTILRYGYVILDKQGKVVTREPDTRRAAFGGNRGLAIEFQKDGEQARRYLYYFSANIENRRLTGNQPLLNYMAALPRVATMLKSTSYMLHQKNFSLIRDRILERSAAIVQDDSGVPYRYFQPDKWELRLFGQYDRPYGSFRYLEQPDLKEAYSHAKPLSFAMGYGQGRVPSNLQVAIRKR